MWVCMCARVTSAGCVAHVPAKRTQWEQSWYKQARSFPRLCLHWEIPEQHSPSAGFPPHGQLAINLCPGRTHSDHSRQHTGTQTCTVCTCVHTETHRRNEFTAFRLGPVLRQQRVNKRERGLWCAPNTNRAPESQEHPVYGQRVTADGRGDDPLQDVVKQRFGGVWFDLGSAFWCRILQGEAQFRFETPRNLQSCKSLSSFKPLDVTVCYRRQLGLWTLYFLDFIFDLVLFSF